MPDNEYIIDIILRARDEMGAALAKATAEVEAYRKTVEAADRDTSRSTQANREYSKTLNTRTDAEKRLAAALKTNRLTNGEQVATVRQLQKAHQDLAKAETESDPINQVDALQKVSAARNKLINQLQEEDAAGRALSKRTATIRTNQINEELRYQATTARTRQLSEAQASAEADTAKALNAELEKLRKDRQQTNKQIGDAEIADAKRQGQARIDAEIEAGRKADQERRARERNVERSFTRLQQPANVLADPGSTVEQEAEATKKLNAERQILQQNGMSLVEAERAIHNARQDALHDLGFETKAARDAEAARRDGVNAANELNAELERIRKERQRVDKQIGDAEVADAKRQGQARIDAEVEAARKEDQEARARASAKAQRESNIERSFVRMQQPARVLADSGSSVEQEAEATRKLNAERQLLQQNGMSLAEAEHAIHNVRQDALHDLGYQTQAIRDAEVAQRDYERVINDVAAAEQKRSILNRRLVTAKGVSNEQKDILRQEADVDVVKARTKLDKFRVSERARHINIPVDVKVDETKIEAARARMAAEAAVSSRGGAGAGGAGSTGGIQAVVAAAGDAKKAMADLDTTTIGFGGHLRGAFTFAAVAMIQPLMALIAGLVSAFASLASAAVAAGAALGVTFVSAIAQGIPVMGVFAAALQRLQGVFGLVSAGLQQQQQRFIAHYETVKQNAMGINQIAIAQHNYSNALYAAGQAAYNVTVAEHQYSDAVFSHQQAVRNVTVSEHNYSDALYAQQSAVRNVRIAQLSLEAARLSATRQLQDLVAQETNARLAAEGSSLAVTQAAKNLRAVIGAGGDVQSAQLQLQQAQAQHTQATTNAQRAITDAASGSIARQQISQNVSGAQKAVEDAKRAVVDANFQVAASNQAITASKRAVVDADFALVQARQGIVQAQRAVADSGFQLAQARAAIIQARQAAAGYNLATAAQLAYLRSQMSRTELALDGNITRILDLFRGANAFMRPITDAILGAFVPLTGRIRQLLTDPKLFGPFLNLARTIGGAIQQITRQLLDKEAVSGFISLINAAADNIKPFAQIVISFFRAAGSIAVTAIPFVHQFLGFISQLVTQFSNWARSTQGKNWLKGFFDVAFQSLEAFIRLGASIAGLIAAVVDTGGGAQSGINILKTLQGWVDRTTASINSHGKAFKSLHELWSIAVPTVKALGAILGAVGHAFLVISTSSQGQKAFKGTVDLITQVIIPAFTKFVIIMGAAIVKLTSFLNKHPELRKILVDVIAFGAAMAIAGKAVGLIFGPISAIIGLIGKLAQFIEALKVISGLFATIDTEAAIAFLAPIAPIALVVAAIVGLAAVTGNLGNLLKTLEAPFIAIWNKIKEPLNNLVKQFLYFINGVLAPFGVHVRSLGQLFHGVFAGILSVVKTIFSAIGNTIGTILGNAFSIIGDFFKILGDLFRGHFGAVIHDFVKLGKDIVKGLWDSLKAIPSLIVGLFIKMIDAILHFLGISSPSKKMHGIGQAMVDGLVHALSALTGLPTWMIRWIAGALGKLFEFLAGLGGKVVSFIWNGIVDYAKKYFHFEKWLWTTIFNAIWGLLGDLEGLGEKIIKAIVNGIKKAPKLLANAISSLIPQPLKDAASSVGNFFGSLFNKGGAVPGGYGGGDIRPAWLESGEHVLTKEEVSSAGGHGAIFALRQSLGGGTQSVGGRYALGGVAGGGSQTLIQPKTTQGVIGQLGGQLANIRLFVTNFQNDWSVMWQNVVKLTKNYMSSMEDLFNKFFQDISNNWSNTNDKITKSLNTWWSDTNKNAQNGLNKLLYNFDWTYGKIDTDSFNAFWYVMHIAQQAIESFGQKFQPPHLAQEPKMTRAATGGFIGEPGERGQDLVPAWLGRGEAVLNWAHQKIVDPALRAYYGFGIDKMFDKVRGTHAGEYFGGKARPNKFAAGGMVFPFPKNQGFTWERVDQGQDLETTPGGAVLAIAPGNVRPAHDRFSGFGPYYAEETISSGPLAGRGIYYGHIKATKFGNVNAGDIIGVTQQRANTWTAAPAGWLELGFLPYGSMSAGNAIAPILHELAAGHRVIGVGGISSGVAAVWNAIAKQTVRGSGAFAQLMKAGIGKVTDAANTFGQQKADQAGSSIGGQVGANFSGPWVNVMAQIAKKFNWSLPDWKWLVNAESSGNPEIVNPSSGAFGLGQFLGATARAYAKFGALSHDPVKQIEAMGQYILDRYKNPTVAKAFHLAHNWYAKGGFAGNAIPILGHAGEWVLNQAHQSKLGSWLGEAPGKVADALGLTGGKTEFREGGIIGGNAPALTLQPTITSTQGIKDPASIEQTQGFTFTENAIGVVRKAQQILTRAADRMNRSTKAFDKNFNTYLDNLNQIIGDNGLLALAVQALDTMTNQESALVSLAASGMVRLNRSLQNSKNWVGILSRSMTNVRAPETALEVATTDLQTTQALGDNLRQLQHTASNALRDVNSRIAHFGRVTSKNLALYQRLITARKNLTDQITDIDSKLAQNIQDISDKQQTQFQAQLDQTLRGTSTLGGAAVGSTTVAALGGSRRITDSINNIQKVIGRVGPGIATGLAQMAQTIAQTVGNPQLMQQADAAVLDAARRQQSDLQDAYNRAAARAQHDPRWQKVADDLLGQLESATTAVVQAQAQALTDAMQAQDVKAQIQGAALDFFNRLAQVTISMGDNLGGVAQQINISRGRSSVLQGQVAGYQGLLTQAQAEGNTQAVRDLQQKILDLTAQIAEANLQTQQLITAYRQVSVSILQSQTQASSGFFSSANQIAQTLGAIAGNQNLPALINYAREAGAALVTQGQRAVQNVVDAINDPNGPFGANQGSANNLLGQLINAFGQGSQVFANTLAQLAPQLSQFEANLPQDQQQLFQGLIQALIDNTVATVDNNQQLQNLNATTNQQQFQSTAWAMFRQAIFTGLGTLLPQYAMNVPSLDVGGMLMSNGLFFGHKGEVIVPANAAKGNTSTMSQTNHFTIDHPVEVADPVLFGNQVAWRLSHDPNSR